MIFIDYQNVHGAALRAFWPRGTHPAHGHIDPLLLGRLIVDRRIANGLPSELAQIRVYRGRPSPDRQSAAAAANDRQTATWTRSPEVVVNRRPLRYPRQWPTEPAMEKGIDVALAVDVLRLAVVECSYDVAVVFSADSDLLPAVETVMELGCAHVEVAAWRGGPRMRAVDRSRPWCHWLHEPDYRRVEDLTDYSKR